jgi:hypothetical protein
MSKMKLKVFILICQFIRISDFENLMLSLNSGDKVRVIIHYGLCKWAPDQKDHSPVPDAITGMDIDTYEYFAPGVTNNKTAFVVFGNSKLIKNPMGKGFVYNYGKVKINADNTVLVNAKYIHPKSFKVLMDESFIGTINNGTNNEGISLFK